MIKINWQDHLPQSFYRAIIFFLVLLVSLTACAYNGLSGSSSGGDSTAAIEGLWIQSSSAELENPDGSSSPSCGCRDTLATDNPPRRCFNYFANGRVVSGYLIISNSYAGNCNAAYSLSPSVKAALFTEIDRVIDLGLGSPGTTGEAVMAVGEFRSQGDGQQVMIAGITRSGGTFFDIFYPPGPVAATAGSLICTSYHYRQDSDPDILFIAASPSGGSARQINCNSERFRNLIQYTKVERQ